MRLNQVTVPARDLDASIAFYEKLGFRLIVKHGPYARFELPDGESTLSAHATDEFKPGDVHIYFECEDLDSRVAGLKAKGIVFDSDPEDQRWLWREACLSDPAGVKLCLYHAGENRRYPPWRLGG